MLQHPLEKPSWGGKTRVLSLCFEISVSRDKKREFFPKKVVPIVLWNAVYLRGPPKPSSSMLIPVVGQSKFFQILIEYGAQLLYFSELHPALQNSFEQLRSVVEKHYLKLLAASLYSHPKKNKCDILVKQVKQR